MQFDDLALTDMMKEIFSGNLPEIEHRLQQHTSGALDSFQADLFDCYQNM